MVDRTAIRGQRRRCPRTARGADRRAGSRRGRGGPDLAAGGGAGPQEQRLGPQRGGAERLGLSRAQLYVRLRRHRLDA